MSTCIRTKKSNYQSKCLSKNPYIIHLHQAEGLKVHESPLPHNAATCGGEWKRYKTCCDQSSATKYIAQDKKKIDTAIDLYFHHIKGLSQGFFNTKLKIEQMQQYKTFLPTILRDVVDTLIDDKILN